MKSYGHVIERYVRIFVWTTSDCIMVYSIFLSCFQSFQFHTLININCSTAQLWMNLWKFTCTEISCSSYHIMYWNILEFHERKILVALIYLTVWSSYLKEDDADNGNCRIYIFSRSRNYIHNFTDQNNLLAVYYEAHLGRGCLFQIFSWKIGYIPKSCEKLLFPQSSICFLVILWSTLITKNLGLC